MNSFTASILTIFGLILTMFGMGGIEHSVTDEQMWTAAVVCVLGLLSMFAGTTAMNVSRYYD